MAYKGKRKHRKYGKKGGRLLKKVSKMISKRINQNTELKYYDITADRAGVDFSGTFWNLTNMSQGDSDTTRDEEIFNNFPNAFIKYHKGIDRARTIFENNTRRNWEMEVRIYWGEPGTGKTRSAIEEFPDAYCKMKGKWWDHYKGEKCVIIDDFDPSNCFDFTFDFYLKLLDRYPLLIEYKGGSREFSSKVIIFTSNFNPDEWFEGKRNRNAFFRRVNVIKEFK